MNKIKRSVFAALVVAGGLSAVTYAGAAQDSAALSSAQTGNGSFYIAKNFSDLAMLPGFSMGAPVGLVPSWGVVFGGISGATNPTGSSTNTDGAISSGFGFGDANKNIGGALTLGIGSINPTDGGEFNRGYAGLSMGHFFVKSLTGVSVGIQNIGGWTAGGDMPDKSYDAAVTQLLPNNFMPVVVTAGLGNNLYAFERSTRPATTSVAPFGAVAVYVLPQVSLIADYTSGVTTLGTSIVPIAKLPIVVSLGARDIFKYEEGRTKISFIGSVGYAYTF